MTGKGSLLQSGWVGLAILLLVGTWPAAGADRVVVAEDFTSVT